MEPKDELTQLATLGRLRAEGIISEKEFRALKERVYVQTRSKKSHDEDEQTDVIVVPDAADSLIVGRSTMAGLFQPDQSDYIDESTMAGFDEAPEPSLHDTNDPAPPTETRPRKQTSRTERQVKPSGTTEDEFSLPSESKAAEPLPDGLSVDDLISGSSGHGSGLSLSGSGHRSGSRPAHGSTSRGSRIPVAKRAPSQTGSQTGPGLSGSRSATRTGSQSAIDDLAAASGFGSGLSASHAANRSHASQINDRSQSIIIIEEESDQPLPIKSIAIAGVAVTAIIIIGLIALVLFFQTQSREQMIDEINDTINQAERRIVANRLDDAESLLEEVLEASLGVDYLSDQRRRASLVMARLNAAREQARQAELDAKLQAELEAERERQRQLARERYLVWLAESWPQRRDKFAQAGGSIRYDEQQDRTIMTYPLPPLAWDFSATGNQALEPVIAESVRHVLEYQFDGREMDTPPIIAYLVLTTKMHDLIPSILASDGIRISFADGSTPVFAQLVPQLSDAAEERDRPARLYFGLMKSDLKRLAAADQPLLSHSELLQGRFEPRHTAAFTLFADILGINLNADMPLDAPIE